MHNILEIPIKSLSMVSLNDQHLGNLTLRVSSTGAYLISTISMSYSLVNKSASVSSEARSASLFW